MLESLRGRASERKLRLFTAACCRRIWHLVPDPQVRAVVDLFERSADGPVHPAELAGIDFPHVIEDAGGDEEPYRTAFMVTGSLAYYVFPPPEGVGHLDLLAAKGTAEAAAAAGGVWPRADIEPMGLPDVLTFAEEVFQVTLVRCIFGNPFRPVAPDPGWLAWDNGAVAHLARSIYDDRRFADLPFLADALEESGCDNADILAHCRQPGPHVRGCWAVDLLLGKG
jgi:hypothetical protein